MGRRIRRMLKAFRTSGGSSWQSGTDAAAQAGDLLGRSDSHRPTLPPLCDWAWRAPPWSMDLASATVPSAEDGTTLGPGTRLFHDCPHAAIALTQAATPDGPAPFGMTMEIGAFDGSFLSMAVDLPEDGATTLNRSHIVRIAARLAPTRPTELFLRLNIRQGPNVEQMVSDLTVQAGEAQEAVAEFDLGFHDIRPARLEGAWIDLIFGTAATNRIALDDLIVTRRPRADI